MAGKAGEPRQEQRRAGAAGAQKIVRPLKRSGAHVTSGPVYYDVVLGAPVKSGKTVTVHTVKVRAGRLRVLKVAKEPRRPVASRVEGKAAQRYSGEPDLNFIERRGRELSEAKLASISKKHPAGTFVAFHLRTGKYVTADDQRQLLKRYEAKFGDEWGWFARTG